MRYEITPVNQPDRIFTGYLQIAVFQQTPNFGHGYYIDNADGGDRGGINLSKVGVTEKFARRNSFFSLGEKN